MAIEQFDIADHVECDGCSKVFTDSDEPGGILFGSKGYGPCCAAKMEADIKRFGEEQYIRDRCPPGMAFKEWVLKLRGGNNTVTILSGDDAERAMQ